MEVGEPSFRVRHFQPEKNKEQLRFSLDCFEKNRDMVRIRAATYQQQEVRYYNSKVKQRSFWLGDLVLRKVMINTKEHDVGTMGPTWKGRTG